MEKASRPFTFVVALTYNEETAHNRSAARVFNYQDVSNFIKRLRRAMDYHLKRTGALSFIACGEKGDRFDRCHWHVVIFSEVDFLTLGEWKAPWGVVTEPRHIISPVGIKEPYRREWSLWGHGFVTVQEPDLGGMRYAMAYALKDQFNIRNAEGKARHAKAEVFGTGYLAMSKCPPIGSLFIDNYLSQCEARGLVPPSRRLVIPEVKWPWWPSGKLRVQLLEGFARINAGIVERTGQNAPGWSTLLHEARLSEDDLELLGVYDGEEEQEDSVEFSDAVYEARIRDNQEAVKRREIKRRCGSSLPCNLCIGHPAARAAFGLVEAQDGSFALASDDSGQGKETIRKRQNDCKSVGPNPFCGLYADSALRARDAHLIWHQSAGRQPVAEGAR